MMETDLSVPEWELVTTTPFILDHIGPYPFCLSVDKSIIMAADENQRLSLYHIPSDKWSSPVPIPGSLTPDGCVGRLDPNFGSVFTTFLMRYPHSGRPELIVRTYNITNLKIIREYDLPLSDSGIYGRITAWTYSNVDDAITVSIGDVEDSIHRWASVFTCELSSSSPSCNRVFQKHVYHAFMADSSRSDYSLTFAQITSQYSTIEGYNRRHGSHKTYAYLDDLGYRICDEVKMYNVPLSENPSFYFVLLCPEKSKTISEAHLVAFDKRMGTLYRVFGKNFGFKIKSLSM